jgi:signal transduction histidine kinase/ActR/RegA family two-component response regulator
LVAIPRRRILWTLAFAGTLGAILAIGFVSYRELSTLADSSAQVQRSYDILQTLDDLDSALTDSEANQRGLLLTHDPTYLSQYDAAVAQIRLAVSELHRLCSTEPGTSGPLAVLGRLSGSRLDDLQRTVHEAAGNDHATLAHLAEGAGAHLIASFRRYSDDLDSVQRHLLQRRREEEHEARVTSEGVLISTIVLSVIFVGAAAAISRRFDERRRELEKEVAERRRAEEYREALLVSERAARAEAERATRLKDEFVATLSHELRTPLNAIVGWASILRRDKRPASVSQGVEVIERNAKVQAQMVEDLLDMSRILSGKLRIDLQVTDPAAVVQAALSSVEPTAQAKEVELQTFLQATGPINADAGRIQQVVWNLLSNAIKFTPRGGRVCVTLRSVAGNAEIEVKDSGQGIRGEFLPFVFDRFRQADASTTRRHGGLGLGLSIVKSLVEMHGGTVHVDSAGEGHGATLTVRLPLVIAHSFTSSAARAELARTPHMPMLDGVRILIVDDEPDARSLAQRVLEERGADVVTADSALEALRLVDGDSPLSLVISDIGMPEQDGYELIRLLRSLPGDAGRIPAVALTALARSEDRHRALTAGYQIHLSKPVDPAHLVAVVANITERHERFAIESRPS